MDLETKLEDIEFRMDLLREGSELAKYLYDCKITRKQMSDLYKYMDSLRQKIDSGESISSPEYEGGVLGIVGTGNLDYHFCELFAKLLWEEQRYEEIFEEVYKNHMRYGKLIKNK